MTPAERKAALVARMVAAAEKTGTGVTYDAIEAALTVALEEAAKVAEAGYFSGEQCASAIRALAKESS